MSLSNRLPLPIAFALLLALVAPFAALAAIVEGPDDGGVAPAVRVVFLDKLGPRAAQKLLMAEGVRRVATFDPSRAVVLSDSPEKCVALEALLRKADPGLLAREPHAPLAAALEGAPEIERTLDTTDAKGGALLVRVIYGIGSMEPARDGKSLWLKSTEERLDAAASLLRLLGILPAT